MPPFRLLHLSSAPGSFVSSVAPSPAHDPVSLVWPNCPAVTLTWLPFTVTLDETTHTLTTLGGVSCPPSCSAA
jgi:hypothetical protein